MLIETLQNSQENPCARVSFYCNFIKKETMAQVFSCEFCKIFKNTFFYRTPPVAASNETSSRDSEKVNLFYLKFKTFMLIIYKLNKYLKSVFTLNAFQGFLSSIKFLKHKSF